MKITLESLKHFQAVVRFQNLNLAARKINISPSAISRSIKIIEEDLGYPLFSRIGRKIVLNPEGARFYDKSVSLIESYQSLYTDTTPSSLQGTYKLGASHWLAGKYLAPKLEKLIHKHPATKFEIYSLESQVAVLKVLSGDLDMALCFSPKPHAELISHELFSGELILAAGKGHPLASMKPNSVIKELNHHHAIIHKANDLIISCDDHPMLIKYNIQPKLKFFWDSDYTAIELLKTNRYWTMLPDVIAEHEKSLVPLQLPKSWHAPYSASLIVHKDKPKAFIESMLSALT